MNLQPEEYEKRFHECDARSEAVFTLTSAASKIIDSDLTILNVNQALTDLLGYSKEEIVGTQILQYACDEDKPHWHELQEAMWKHGKPNFKLDACLIRKDSSIAYVHVTTIAFKEKDTAYAYTILDDFTVWIKMAASIRDLDLACIFQLKLLENTEATSVLTVNLKKVVIFGLRCPFSNKVKVEILLGVSSLNNVKKKEP